MGLFNFLRQKSKNRNSLGDELTHLTPDGELPWGWLYANREFTEKIEAEYRHFFDVYIASKKEGVLARYSALKSLVLFMNDAKKLCRAKGECFEKWSEFMVANPVDMEAYKRELDHLETNMDELLKEEKMLIRLKADLINIIDTEPGVIQSDLYKRFDPSMKSHISNELYSMAAQNMIVREKSGRSYKLYKKLKQGEGTSLPLLLITTIIFGMK